jgi:putative redox protein
MSNPITFEGVMAVIAAGKEDDKALAFTYGSESKIESGCDSIAQLSGGHTVSFDEPESMPGGKNKGPSPLEVVCGSFGTCQEITYKMYATVMGIDLKSVSCAVEGDINLAGFVGVADKTGFTNINATITLDTDASDEQLEQLKTAVDTHCPLAATLSESVPLETTITQVKNAAKEGISDDPVKAADIMGVIGAGKEDENALKMMYGSTSKLAGSGLTTKLEMNGHSMTVDEPETMPGGSNQGPNPLDLFCASFGSCQEISYKYYAAVMDVPVNSVSCKVSAPCDLRGLVGLGGNVGLASVKGDITIDSPANEEQIAQLKGAVDAKCPMVDTLKCPVAVSTKWVRA